MQQQAADRIGRAAAVLEQLGEVGVVLLGHVLREGVEQIVEQGERQAVRGDDARQIAKQRVGRRVPRSA